MDKLHRRDLLAGLAGASLATVGTVAAHPAAKPRQTACVAADEHPWRRIKRIAADLSEALQAVREHDGVWRAFVDPVEHEFPVSFVKETSIGDLSQVIFQADELIRKADRFYGDRWSQIVVHRDGDVYVSFPVALPDVSATNA